MYLRYLARRAQRNANSDWLANKPLDQARASAHEIADKGKTAEQLLGAVNDSSQRARTLFATMIVAGLYHVIVLTTTDHQTLLYGIDIQLPLLSISVPVLGFFVISPLVFFVLHLELVLEAALLGERAARLRRKIDLSSPEQRQDLLLSAHSLPLTQISLGGGRAGTRLLFGLLVWLMIVLFPLTALIATQIVFLAYHSELVTWIHRVLVVLDAGILVYLWSSIRSPSARFGTIDRVPAIASAWWLTMRRLARLNPKAALRRSWRQAHTFSAAGTARIWLAAVTVGLASTTVLLVPSEWLERSLVSVMPDSLVVGRGVPLREHAMLLPTCILLERSDCGIEGADRRWSQQGWRLSRNLIMASRLLIHRSSDQLMSIEEFASQPLAEQLNSPKLDISGRDLRYADLSFAYIPRLIADDKTNLSGADLRYSTILSADLAGANLSGVRAQGAYWPSANLERIEGGGINADKAHLPGVNLTFAHLIGASFQDAFMPGATFVGTSLWATRFDGANLSASAFGGSRMLSNVASMRYADLRGSSGLMLDQTEPNPDEDPFSAEFRHAPPLVLFREAKFGALPDEDASKIESSRPFIRRTEPSLMELASVLPRVAQLPLQLSAAKSMGLTCKSLGREAVCGPLRDVDEGAEKLGQRLAEAYLQRPWGPENAAFHRVGILLHWIEPLSVGPTSEDIESLNAFKGALCERSLLFQSRLSELRPSTKVAQLPEDLMDKDVSFFPRMQALKVFLEQLTTDCRARQSVDQVRESA
jgi:uncharacterized protein YjbI with pentapeptide repeats